MGMPGVNRIDAPTLFRWITDGEELAVFDAREEAEFAQAHLFWAVCCPLSRREIQARSYLPRLSARVVCVDDGRGVAETLAAYLLGIGATDVSVLEGGIEAWRKAGYCLFSGTSIPAKAFAEWVEHEYGTESVEPGELNAWLHDGRDMVVLDSRTPDEFKLMTIPTSTNVPGGELVYRIGDLVPDPNTLVVINCAGRTRSIMGAESLRRAGIPNRVIALRNGTMGWELAGFTCEKGSTRRYPVGRPGSAAVALKRVKRFAAASGVKAIDGATLAGFRADCDRTLYVFDVRGADEFAAGHLPGARHVPGGQLIQTSDQWIGVRNARILVLDDDGVRARMTASWLRQLGHREVYILEDDAARPLEKEGSVPPIPEAQAAKVPRVTPEQVRDGGAVVIDLVRSIDFRAGHIPGARWGLRTRLERLKPLLGTAQSVVLTSPDGIAAALAVDEVKGLTSAPLSLLEGGTAAWKAMGFPLEATRAAPPDEDCVDFLLRPFDRNSGVEEAMRQYLAWEVDLVRQIEHDKTVCFWRPPSQPAIGGHDESDKKTHGNRPG
jgi:rhodanese-related sulfurtransferase